jgi:hypothetical protein
MPAFAGMTDAQERLGLLLGKAGQVHRPIPQRWQDLLDLCHCGQLSSLDRMGPWRTRRVNI